MPLSAPLRRGAVAAALVVLPAALAAAHAPGSSAAHGAVAAQPRLAIDSARLLADLGALAADSMEGRSFGTPGGARARALVADAFAEAGLVPLPPERGAVPAFVHPFEVPGAWWKRLIGRPVAGANVVGLVRGTRRPDRYVVVTAHYDHLGREGGVLFPGSDDNASGTATLLAMARVVAAAPAEHSVLFVATDAEERGMHGARAFVSSPPVPKSALALNVNLDMVSRASDGVLWAAGPTRWPRLRPVLQGLASEAPVRLRLGHDDPSAGADDWTDQSDQAVFHDAGIPFVYFGVEDHPDYHRPGDVAARADTAFFVNAARTALLALRRLDAQLDRVAPARTAALGARRLLGRAAGRGPAVGTASGSASAHPATPARAGSSAPATRAP